MRTAPSSLNLMILGLCAVSACSRDDQHATGTCDMRGGTCVAGGPPVDQPDLSQAVSAPDLAVSNGSTVVCPAGLSCDVACASGTTTVSGKVYDPAGKNPLYHVAVYVPQSPLVALPEGVPTGADACSCAALYKSGGVVSAATAEDGSFTLSNVPVGSSVPLVIQIGKWRRKFTIEVKPCQDNPQPDRSLTFLGSIPAGDVESSMPHIAVSTGSADTLECLMQRIGIPSSEYVAGAATGGHVHVFSGGKTGCGGGSCSSIGAPEQNHLAGAPASSSQLWSSVDQLMPYDLLLLSCEGGETYNANPPALESYLNAGGRVFASHFHYSWFSGPILSSQSYSAPADWGSNIATWNGGGGSEIGPIGGVIETTLNGTSTPFGKGVALKKWLGNVGALGTDGVGAEELAIHQPRYNAHVASTDAVASQWITADAASSQPGAAMYLSFDTPIGAAVNADLGAPSYCGRAVFSDLHVGAGANDKPPTCTDADLTPQEKALEFMLFDLSSCVTQDILPPQMSPPVL